MFCAFVRDISDRRLSEEQVRRAVMLHEREEFLSALVQEIENPLTASNKIIDLLAGGQLGEVNKQQRRILLRLKETNRSLIDLILHLQETYRNERCASSLVFDDVNPAEIIATGMENSSSIAEWSGVKLVMSIHGRPRKMNMDKSAICRVVCSVLDNAIRLTPRGGTVRLKLLFRAKQVFIMVKDTVTGSGTRSQSAIFRRIWQGATGKIMPSRAGIGLYLSKQIVEAHGGIVLCRCKKDTGTTFAMVLPG